MSADSGGKFMSPEDVIAIFAKNPYNFPMQDSTEKSKFWKCGHCRNIQYYSFAVKRPGPCLCGSERWEKMEVA